MNTNEARQEINRRLNILNQKPIPIKNKLILRGGMSNINQRRDTTKYAKEIGTQKEEYSKKLSFLNSLSILDEQAEIDLGTFNEPRWRGWF
jgi:hypothetical protein